MAQGTCKRFLDIKFEQDRSGGIGTTFGNGQTDRHTYIFLNHSFRMWK